MKISIKQLRNLLVTLTQNESDQNLFCSQIRIEWEDEEFVRNDTRQIESHAVSVSWDLDAIGWIVNDLHWIRPEDEGVMIFTHESMFSDAAENESEFSGLIFDLGGKDSNYRWDINAEDPIENHEIVINLPRVRSMQVTKLKLRGDPTCLQLEVSNSFETQKISSRSSDFVIDETKFDENGHINIDDWNPYESDESYFGIDAESMMLNAIWKKTVEELQFPLDISVLKD